MWFRKKNHVEIEKKIDRPKILPGINPSSPVVILLRWRDDDEIYLSLGVFDNQVDALTYLRLYKVEDDEQTQVLIRPHYPAALVMDGKLMKESKPGWWPPP